MSARNVPTEACAICKSPFNRYCGVRCCYSHDSQQPICSTACLAQLPPNSFGGKHGYAGTDVPCWVSCMQARLKLPWGRRMDDVLAKAAYEVPLATGRDENTVEMEGSVGARILGAATGVPVATPEALLALCRQAPCGVGAATVTDTTVRRTLRIADLGAVRVEWPGLDAAVAEAAARLRPHSHSGLRAELHDVLCYRDGDFFQPHRDATKAAGHVATMSVVLAPTDPAAPVDGGTLVVYAGHPTPATCRDGAQAAIFAERARYTARGVRPPVPLGEGEEERHLERGDEWAVGSDASSNDGDKSSSRRWDGRVPGEWAAWLNSAYHEVLPVRSESTGALRVVAIYNLIVDETIPVAPFAVDLACSAANEPTAPTAADDGAATAVATDAAVAATTAAAGGPARISDVPRDVLEHHLLPALPPAALAALAATSRAVRAALWTPVNALACSLRSRLPTLRGCARAVGSEYLVLACDHEYPLNGQGCIDGPNVLRGRDAAVFEACRTVFGAAAVIPAHVVTEHDDERFSPRSTRNTALVAPRQLETPDDEPARIATEIGVVETSSVTDLNSVDLCQTELDSDCMSVRVFKNAIVIREPARFPGRNGPPIAGRYYLWGNGATIDMYCFSACAVCVPISLPQDRT